MELLSLTASLLGTAPGITQLVCLQHSFHVWGGGPGEGCPSALVEGKGGLCGVGWRELGLSRFSGVRGFMLYIALI